MATVKEIKATARPKAGKGAARSERRAGKVPGVIYGDSKPPITISLDYADLRQKIYAGRFLTTIYDLELDGQKHRVIPRDFQLDAVRDNPLHVDFMRLGEGAVIRVAIPIRVVNAETAPGVKRGGASSSWMICMQMLLPAVDISGSPRWWRRGKCRRLHSWQN